MAKKKPATTDIKNLTNLLYHKWRILSICLDNSQLNYERRRGEDMEQCKKILEKQLQLLFEEGKETQYLEKKLEINKELCRTAQMIILLNHQSQYGAAGGTRRTSSQP